MRGFFVFCFFFGTRVVVVIVSKMKRNIAKINIKAMAITAYLVEV